MAGFRVISTLIDLMINALLRKKRIHSYDQSYIRTVQCQPYSLYGKFEARAGLHIGHDRRICARPLPEDQRPQSAGRM